MQITPATSEDKITVTSSVAATSILFIMLPYLVKKSEATKTKTKSYLAFPYGVLSMATYLENYSKTPVRIEILDLNLFTAEEIPNAIQSSLEKSRPDIVGLSLMFDQSYRYVSDVASQVKKFNNETLVLMGGAATTTSWDGILHEQDSIDALCYSEGETAIRGLVDTKPEDRRAVLQNHPWVTRQSLENKRRPLTIYVENLNDVVNINYDLVDVTAYSMKEAFSPFASYRNEENVRQFFIVTSRGCPFKCVFCAEPSLHGATMRYIDVDVIIDHVEFLIEKYGLNVLTFYDDQLLLHTERAKELFRRLAPFNIRVEAPNGVTLAYIDDEMAYLMKQAGFDTIPLAIESGSDFVLNKVIKKPLKVKKVKPVVELLQRNGIFVQAFFVIGLPGEMDEHRRETLDLIQDADVDWSGFSLATPIRGSELYTICKEKGYIDADLGIGDIMINEYIIHAPEIGLDAVRIPRQAYLMNLEVNFVNNRQMRIGNYETAVRCFDEVIERYENHAFAHYYLAEALEKLGGRESDVKRNREIFWKLVETDDTWRDYSCEFGLIEPRLAVEA